MIEPDMGWFEIVKVPTFDLYEVTGGNENTLIVNLPGQANCLATHV